LGGLAGFAEGVGAAKGEEGDHPGTPPEDRGEGEAGAFEGGEEGVGKVAAAVALDGVELAEKLGQGGDAEDEPASGAEQTGESGDGGAVVVEMLDDVEREDGVEEGGGRSGEVLRQVGLDQTAGWPFGVEPFQGAAGEVEAGRFISGIFEHQEGGTPAATGVEDAGGWVDVKLFQESMC
jgi:hypothetical protein